MRTEALTSTLLDKMIPDFNTPNEKTVDHNDYINFPINIHTVFDAQGPSLRPMTSWPSCWTQK